MEHLSSIIWLFSFPLLIYLAYRSILIAIKLFEKNNTENKELIEQ